MTSEQKRNCFVVGPIGSDESQTRIDADFLLQGIIRDALGNLDPQLHIWRADEDSRPGMITDKVIADINDSDLVIADLTELNPNVFYELGIRHAAAKPTIHMAAVGTKLPFDNFGHRVIFFDKRNWDNVVEARRRLRSQALEALADGFEVSNPVTQALSAKAFRASASTEEKIISDLMKRLAFLENQVSKNKKIQDTRTSSDFVISDALDRAISEKYHRISNLEKIAQRLSAEGRFSEHVIKLFSESNSNLHDYSEILEAIEKW